MGLRYVDLGGCQQTQCAAISKRNIASLPRVSFLFEMTNVYDAAHCASLRDFAPTDAMALGPRRCECAATGDRLTEVVHADHDGLA